MQITTKQRKKKMKKLVIALAAVALAVSAQAASFNWKTSATGKIYSAGTTTLLASGTAYLFDSAAVTQQAVLDAVLGGGALNSLATLSSASVSAGAIATTPAFDWGSAGDTLNAFMAIVDGDNVFISATVAQAADASATKTFQFNAKAASQAAAMESTTFTSAGWYTAVPEPTSGLLMLVGLAGLALRRRRA